MVTTNTFFVEVSVLRPGEPPSGQLVEVQIVRSVELAQFPYYQRVNLRVLATLVLIQAPLSDLIIHSSDAVEAFGGVVHKVLPTDLMWKAEEGLNLCQLGQWVVDELVAIDDVQLLFGEELVKIKIVKISI